MLSQIVLYGPRTQPMEITRRKLALRISYMKLSEEKKKGGDFLYGKSQVCWNPRLFYCCLSATSYYLGITSKKRNRKARASIFCGKQIVILSLISFSHVHMQMRFGTQLCKEDTHKLRMYQLNGVTKILAAVEESRAKCICFLPSIFCLWNMGG